jgi:hypothetical protein
MFNSPMNIPSTMASGMPIMANPMLNRMPTQSATRA